MCSARVQRPAMGGGSARWGSACTKGALLLVGAESRPRFIRRSQWLISLGGDGPVLNTLQQG